jgi:hypothetical protein
MLRNSQLKRLHGEQQTDVKQPLASRGIHHTIMEYTAV